MFRKKTRLQRAGKALRKKRLFDRRSKKRRLVDALMEIANQDR